MDGLVTSEKSNNGHLARRVTVMRFFRDFGLHPGPHYPILQGGEALPMPSCGLKTVDRIPVWTGLSLGARWRPVGI